MIEHRRNLGSWSLNAPLILEDETRHKTIGAILVEAGRLRVEEVERILRLQARKGMTFGQAGQKLRILSEDDIQFALARQFDHPYLMPDRSRLNKELVGAFSSATTAVEDLGKIRNQLMLRWFSVNGAGHPIAVVSPNRRDGRSWLAANLAISFAQLGERTLLIDGDLRRPRQHLLFGLGNKLGLTTLLARRRGEGNIQPISELTNLSVLTAGAEAPNPQELLTRPDFTIFLNQARKQYSVVLIDTPPASDYADAQMLAVRAGAALVIGYAKRSRVAQLERMAADMRDGGAEIVGSIFRTD